MRPMSRMVLLLLTSVGGCAGGTAERADRTAHAPPAIERGGQDEPDRQEASPPAAAAAPTPVPAAMSGKVTSASENSLPDRVEAGSIERPVLLAMLSSGVGRFLQKVRAEPHLEAGHFVGWRLLGFHGEGESRALRPGDTVMRVNGQGIERPEQFKDVWDSLATHDELVLLVQRAGKRSELHYHIVK